MTPKKSYLRLGNLAALALVAVLFSAPYTVLAEESAVKNPDPWESFNRRIFAFDMVFDRYVFKPAAVGYRKTTPSWGQKMVTNFFDNLKDVRGGINALLQARLGQAGSNFSRVLINSTMGVGACLMLPADAGIKSYNQDFGLTLARWGVKSGPYVVLPFLGPSTVRDTVALVPGTYTWPPHYLDSKMAVYTTNIIYGVSVRASVLELEKSVVGDKYLFCAIIICKVAPWPPA